MDTTDDNTDRQRSMSDIPITDLIRASWEDARREADPERKAQLERDAAILEDVWGRSKYALAPTREQFQAALGNTTLNISDTLAVLASGQRQVDARVGEIHEYVQQNNTLFSQFFDMFPPKFEAFQSEARAAWEESGRRLKKHDDDIETLLSVQNEYGSRLNALDDIEAWRGKVDKELIEAGVRMSKIEKADRDDIRTEIKNTNTEITSMKEMLKRYDSELRELVDRLAARGGNENGSG